MRLHSLRTQLLMWLLVPLALFVAFNSWVAYNNAIRMATVVHDRMLLGSARIIAEQVRYEDGMLQVIIPPAALELFQSDSHDRVYYRITGPSHGLLAGSADLPAFAAPLRSEESAYFDTEFRGEPVRVAAFSQPVFAAPEHGPVLIEVAQTRHSYEELADKMWRDTVQQQLLILALAAILLWIGMHRGLAPMMQLRDTVQRRKPNTLEPLDPAPVPHELEPLVHAINDYVKRLDEHMSAHSRFITNASHQLRTPLTVLNTQVNYGLRSRDIEDKDAALAAINNGVQHGIRLVNQLLMLSTAEERVGRRLPHSEVNLIAVVRRVLEELATLAQTKNIDLGFDFQEDAITVRDTLSMLDELVSNLVDNALRYTPAGGIVTVAVSRRADRVILRIEDNGPGIPPQEREHVFERFYRLQADRSDGSGLGLAIVREIAAACEAEVTLSAPAAHQGLIVTVVMPSPARD
jgi:two-component system sensor histidine kinase TctE